MIGDICRAYDTLWSRGGLDSSIIIGCEIKSCCTSSPISHTCAGYPKSLRDPNHQHWRTQGVSQLPRGEYQPFYHCCWIAFLMTPVDYHSNLQVSTKRFSVPNVVLTVGNAKIWSTWSLPCRDEVWSTSETGLVDKWLLLGRRMWRWRKALMQPFRWEHVLVEDLLIRCQGEGSWKRRFFLVPSSKGTLITFIARILEMSFDVCIFGPNLHLGAMNWDPIYHRPNWKELWRLKDRVAIFMCASVWGRGVVQYDLSSGRWSNSDF